MKMVVVIDKNDRMMINVLINSFKSHNDLNAQEIIFINKLYEKINIKLDNVKCKSHKSISSI
jgi:hypothetical protein